MKGIVKFLHMKTHVMIFFLKIIMLIEKSLGGYVYSFRETVRLTLSSDLEGYFHFEHS